MFRGTVRPLAVFCGGALCAFFLHILFSLPVFLLSAAAFLCFLLSVWFGKVFRILKTVAVLFLGFSFGFLWQGAYDLCFLRQPQKLAGQTQRIDFTVTQIDTYGMEGTIRIGSSRQKLYLTFYENADIAPGDRVCCDVTFSLPSYRGGFDGKRYYASDGIFLLAAPVDYESITVEKEVSRSYTLLGKFRSWVGTKAGELFGGDFSAMKALLLGEKDSFTDAQTEQLSTTGLSHAFVVSGMHLSFLSGVLRFLTVLSPYMIIPVLFLIAFYAVLTGFGLSVVRALLMLIYDQLGELFELQPDPITSLPLSLLIILLPNPYALLNIGLIFSYLAVSGILFLKPWISEGLGFPLLLHSPYSKITVRMRSLFSSLSTSLSAGIATLPAVGYYMGSVSLVFLPSNLLLLFPISFCFYTGLFSLSVYLLIPPLGRFLSLPVKFVFSLFWDADRILAGLPYAQVGVASTGFCIFLFSAVLLLFLLAVFQQRLFHPLPVGLLICGYLIASISGALSDYRTDFTLYCPSSSYPCALITVGNASVLLGYDEKIPAVLRQNNITQVDYYIPISSSSSVPADSIYRNKIQEPASIYVGEIVIGYSYDGNVSLQYRDQTLTFLLNVSYPPDHSDILFITPTIVSNSAMQILLGGREAVLLGKPSVKSHNNIVFSSVPYYDGDYSLSFFDGKCF